MDAALTGASVKTLADRLALSPRTVEHHLSSAYRKLGVAGRPELLAHVARWQDPSPSPVTRYARTADAHIAYQTVGDGPSDLVLIPGFVSNVETAWTWPAQARFQRRLATGRRLIVFDKRGTGLSDPVTDPSRLTLEERMDEVRAVMDAADSRKATLFGFSEGAALSMLFAATYPTRTEGLILYGALISGSLDSDSLGTTGVFDDPEAAWQLMQEAWGTGQFLAPFSHSAIQEPGGIEHVARFERYGASPAAAYAVVRMAASIEVRTLCPAVAVPALVMHRAQDALVPVANSRYLAEHLPSARYVETEGLDHPPWLGDTDAVITEVERFLAERLAARRERPAIGAGVLVALLACDRSLDGQALRKIERFRGRPVLSAAGTIYAFDGAVRAASCALALAKSGRRVAVHAGEVRYTPRGMEGGAVDTTTALLDAAPPGTAVTSTALRELTLGSPLRFEPAGRAALDDSRSVDVLRLATGDVADPR